MENIKFKLSPGDKYPPDFVPAALAGQLLTAT